ncbi:TIGR00180 family glycosyltransferase [Desulfosporosinus sp. PR]|uniref:TIGR00180 family glycosyltransferase n=1 Tax=Candidatus Desulfosporosinus nitrosoreducens TaxID=3401928 RepID=UPI0027EA615D|nr:TIGR00180 family glycosyltransferase [Desulfosporosinus sp. PR]MDQ7096256.1 TIGR00180 family glycosyltransferase [Desulfosporosinus sp. PR]
MEQSLELFAKQIKENIKFLIEKEKIAEATLLINDYLRLISSDIEIYSMKAIVHIMQGEFEEAKNILNKGLEFEPKNYDLLYNLAFVYEVKEDYLQSLTFYRKALRSNYYDIDRTEVEGKIKQLKAIVRDGVRNDLFLSDILEIDTILFIDFSNNEQVNELAVRLLNYGLVVDIAYMGVSPLMNLKNSIPYRKILGITNINDLIEYVRYYDYDVVHLFSATKEIESYFKLKHVQFTRANINCKTDSEIIENYRKNRNKQYANNNRHYERYDDKITIVIPTYNRSYYLNRTLNFINNYKYLKPKVLVLDSSEEGNAIANEKSIEKYTSYQIVYKRYSSNIRLIDKFDIALLELVNTEYVIFCFDDDYLTEEGILESIKILDSDKALFSVKGKNLYYPISSENLIEYDWFETLIDNNPIDRLKKITQGFVANLVFQVFRTKEYKELQFFRSNINKLLPKNETFDEYLYHFLKIITGKIKKINVDLNIRDQSIPRTQIVKNFPHLVIDGTFNENYHAFCDVLKRYFTFLGQEIENIDEEIEMIFINFLANFLKIPRQFIKINKKSGFDLRVLEAGMRKSWVWPSNL